jgi:hypothetical protein
MQKPTFSQIEALSEVFRRDEGINNKFETDNAFTLLEKLSLAWYKRILWLLFKKKRFELNQDLKKLGFKLK